MTTPQDQHKRSLVKTVTWRITGSSATATLAYVITGDLNVAGSLGVFQALTNSVLYWMHERLWTKVSWGVNKENKHG